MVFKKQTIRRNAVTRNGIEETCRWDKPSPCPRHVIHLPLGEKNTFTFVPLEEEYSGGVGLDEYNNYSNERVIRTRKDLTEEERLHINRYMFVEIDSKGYRDNNNGVNLDEFRLIKTAEDLTEEEFNYLSDNGFIAVDEVICTLEDNGYMEVEQKDTQAPYMRLSGWFVEDKNMNIPEYIEKFGDTGEVLSKDIEWGYMNGGCAVYALALKQLNPDLQIAVEVFGDEKENALTYNHVFCIDTKTGHAYDARGKFETADKLYDYVNTDPLTDINPTNVTGSKHELWNEETLKDFIDDGFFTYDDTPEDLLYTKQLIQKFKTRFA